MRGFRKETERPGEMRSACQDDKRGFGFPLSEDELSIVTMNEPRGEEGRSALEDTFRDALLTSGEEQGRVLWGLGQFEKQTIDVMICLEEVEPRHATDDLR